MAAWDTAGNNIGANAFLGSTSAEPLRIRTNNVEKMIITTDGNVGIGTPTPFTPTPGARLTVAGGDITWGNNSRLGRDQGGSIELGGDSNTAGTGTPYIDFHFSGLAQDFNTRIINDASGQLTIYAGTLRTLGQVAITGGAIVGAGGNAVLKVRHIDGKHWQNDSNDPLHLNWNTGQPVIIGQSTARAPLLVTGDATIGAGSNGILRTRHIDGKHYQNDNNDGLYLNYNTGHPVVIGGAQQASLTVNGDATITNNLGTHGYPPTPLNPNWGGGLRTWDVEAEGTIWSMNGYAQGSDARMKANVTKLDNVLDKLDAIRGVSFERIQLGAPTARAEQRRDIGVIAQEVETVFPELVSVHGHEDNKAVNYSGLTGVLIESVKDLKAQNEALRSRIEALETGIEK